MIVLLRVVSYICRGERFASVFFTMMEGVDPQMELGIAAGAFED
jgi:hypothetical protein